MRNPYVVRQDLSKEEQIKYLFSRFFLSSAAAMVAETVTYPLDMIKTRIQIQNDLIKKHIILDSKNLPHGMFRIGVNLVKHEGVFSLWTGVTPAVYRQVVYTGFRLVIYENFRDIWKHNESFPIWQAVIIGVTSGALAQLIASPTDLVKSMMQAEGKRKLEGHAPRVKNMNQAFVEIYKQGGFRGLWRGCLVNVQRAALVNLGDLATYDYVKHFLIKKFGYKDDYKVHTMSSILSGLVAATMGTPADLIKTRIMCQPTDASGKGQLYRSSWHCLVLTVKNEGFFGLYKGYWPIWLRMAPWSLTFWLTYEEIRKLFGLNGF